VQLAATGVVIELVQLEIGQGGRRFMSAVGVEQGMGQQLHGPEQGHEHGTVAHSTTAVLEVLQDDELVTGRQLQIQPHDVLGQGPSFIRRDGQHAQAEIVVGEQDFVEGLEQDFQQFQTLVGGEGHLVERADARIQLSHRFGHVHDRQREQPLAQPARIEFHSRVAGRMLGWRAQEQKIRVMRHAGHPFGGKTISRRCRGKPTISKGVIGRSGEVLNGPRSTRDRKMPLNPCHRDQRFRAAAFVERLLWSHTSSKNRTRLDAQPGSLKLAVASKRSARRRSNTPISSVTRKLWW